MKIHSTRKNGFTLIELLIFLGLFSVLMLVLTNLFTAIVETQIDTQTVSTVENDTKFISSRLMYDIQRAQSITTPSTVGTTSPSLTLSINSSVYTYDVNNNNLRLTVDGVANRLNSMGSRITSMYFKRVGNIGGKNAIRVNLTVEGPDQQAVGRETKVIQTTIGLR